ncbi:MAG: ABC transporter ATP-binding protein [Clostridia bacterium]|nr:ABC transporter ATP-binding protein [Clostridia bacterium]MBR4439451.1 ABC transporter ATP-binding protein [Clostridia bacterium]MBR5942352.1 ABC transporter ATP-binding protein [Clostridia bacterium]
MLRIEHLSKCYEKGTYAVRDLSLHIEKGDVFGFIGHNGAGKTTTIKSATGILEFDEGEIYIDGISIKKDPVECKRKFAYIPDNPELYNNMKGIKYLDFVADIYGVSSADRAARVEKYGRMLEIYDDLGGVISTYSHGMKQKLVIISALIHAPKLLIMDEPFVGLDPKSAHTVKELMAELCSEGGAVFFSTHVLDVAEKICNKMAIIKNGELIASGATADIKGNNSLEEVFLELTE